MKNIEYSSDHDTYFSYDPDGLFTNHHRGQTKETGYTNIKDIFESLALRKTLMAISLEHRRRIEKDWLEKEIITANAKLRGDGNIDVVLNKAQKPKNKNS